jgi:hypothetical protein
MSFQDVRSSRHSTPPRLRRNHPPKLPRVKAIPFTPPSVKQASVNREKLVDSHSKHQINNKTEHRNNTSSLSRKKILEDELIDSFELDMSNSKSSCNSDSSIADPHTESRDDYESFGPDRYQQRYNSSKPTSQPANQQTTKQPQQQNHRKEELKSKSHKSSMSTFTTLNNEMQQFQKMVSDLEHAIQDTIVAPDVAWRTNILVKSVEDTDGGLGEKILHYEQSLEQQERLLTNTNGRSTTNDNRIRQQLAACSKLRRDYNRCHNSMTISLRSYKLRQKAEVSQLGAVQWNITSRGGGDAIIDGSEQQQQQQQPMTQQMEEDFFERKMRQRELERMNESMRQVNEMYHGLAGLVNGQQEDLDQMDDDVNYSFANVRSGYNEYSCFAERQSGMMTFCGDMNEWGQTDENPRYQSDSTRSNDMSFMRPSEGLRVNENFYFSMPFETMKEDWMSVQNDIVGIGYSFVANCKRLDCCNDD